MHRDDPKDRFQQAEALRKENNNAAAQKQYQDTIRLSNERTLERGESRSNRTRLESSNLKKNRGLHTVTQTVPTFSCYEIGRPK